jgi:tetratricopeptide (TPR) repeat protein
MVAMGLLLRVLAGCATATPAPSSQSVAAEPASAESHLSRARGLYKAERYQEGIAELDDALRIAGPRSDILMMRGGAKFRLHAFSGAVQDFSWAIRLDPKDGDAFLMRGIARSVLTPPDKTGACADIEAARQLGRDVRQQANGVDEWCAGATHK